jgi:hypothetical protein
MDFDPLFYLQVTMSFILMIFILMSKLNQLIELILINKFILYLIIANLINSTILIIQVVNLTDAYIDVGACLEFSSNEKWLTVYGSAVVASSIVHSSTSRLLTFTTSINGSVSGWLRNSDPHRLTIRNFTVKNNRVHGVLLETRNIDIRKSIFKLTSAATVLFQPSLFWYEGPYRNEMFHSLIIFILIVMKVLDKSVVWL